MGWIGVIGLIEARGQDSGIGVNAENDIDKGCRVVYLCIVKPESAMWRGWVKSSLT